LKFEIQIQKKRSQLIVSILPALDMEAYYPQHRLVYFHCHF